MIQAMKRFVLFRLEGQDAAVIKELIKLLSMWQTEAAYHCDANKHDNGKRKLERVLIKDVGVEPLNAERDAEIEAIYQRNLRERDGSLVAIVEKLKADLSSGPVA